MAVPRKARSPAPALNLGIGYHLRRTFMALHRRLKASITRHGITPDQYVVLWVLDARGDLTQKEIRKEVYSDGNTIAAILRRMERRGWIQRTRHEADGRAVRVRITPRGQAMRWRIYADAGRIHRQALRGFTAHERKTVFEFLNRMFESVESDGRKR